MGDIVDIGVFICLAYFVSRLGKMQFAAFGWLVTKISLGIAAFMMAAVGAPMLFEQRSPDAPIILTLGLLWIPGPEFIPAFVAHQKWITLTRLLLTIPLVVLGIRTGCWTW